MREQTSNFVRPVVLDTAVPPDGTGVGFTGFPINNRIPIFAKGILASYQGFRNRGLVLLVHADSWPGVSGGPVYLRGGQVIGIITARGQKEFQGVTLARPATFIKALLEANRVAH